MIVMLIRIVQIRLAPTGMFMVVIGVTSKRCEDRMHVRGCVSVSSLSALQSHASLTAQGGIDGALAKISAVCTSAGLPPVMVLRGVQSVEKGMAALTANTSTPVVFTSSVTGNGSPQSYPSSPSLSSSPSSLSPCMIITHDDHYRHQIYYVYTASMPYLSVILSK